MRNSKFVSLLCCGSLSLSGCATPATTNISAGLEWGDSLRHLGISSFYPPREDVRVGDVLLLITSGCTGDADRGIPRTVLLGHLDPQKLYSINKEFYGWRGNLPSAGSSSGVKGGTASKQTQANESSSGSAITSATAKATAAEAAADKAQAEAKAAASALKAKPNDTTAKALAAKRARAATQATQAAGKAKAALAALSTPGAGVAAARSGDLTMHFGDAQTVTVTASTTKSSAIPAAAAAAAPAANDSAKTTESVPEQSSDDPIFAVDGDGKKVEKARPYQRLRQVAFPSVDIGSASDFGADATVPATGLFKIFGGASRQTQSQIRIAASNVVEDQLPLAALYEAASDFFENDAAADSILNHSTIGKLSSIEELRIQSEVRLLGPAAVKACGDWVHTPPVYVVISQVFYAYAFDFDVGNKVGYAAALAVRSQLPAASTVTTPAPSSPTVAGQALQPYLPDQIKSGDGAAGGGLHFEVGHTGNLVLKQSFQHPLAFGYIGNAVFTYQEATDLRAARGNASGTIAQSKRAAGYQNAFARIGGDQQQSASPRLLRIAAFQAAPGTLDQHPGSSTTVPAQPSLPSPAPKSDCRTTFDPLICSDKSPFPVMGGDPISRGLGKGGTESIPAQSRAILK